MNASSREAHRDLGTIIGLLVPWIVQGRPRLASFSQEQTIAFISDLGAFNLKPLFIAGAFATTGLYFVTLIADRIVRHRRYPSATIGEKFLTFITLVGSGLGGTALGLLAIFDDFQFTNTHDRLLVVFILGNLISAGTLVTEYMLVLRHQERHASEDRLLQMSFWMKLMYFLLEVGATVAFVLARLKNINAAAVLEYVNAALFAWFIFSFIMDLQTARRGYQRMPKQQGRPGWRV